MNIKTIPHIVAGTLSLVAILVIGFLYGEVKETNRRIGSMETALKTVEEVNKQNIQDFLKSKEFQTIVDALRVDRETVVQQIMSKLDEHLDDYQKAAQSDPEVKNWDRILVPAWIREKNAREAQSGQRK